MPPSVISLSSQWQRHASNDIAIFHMDDKSSLFTLFFLLFYFRLLQVFPAFFRWRLIDQQADRAGWRWTLVQCSVLWCCYLVLCCAPCWKWENLWDVKQKIEYFLSKPALELVVIAEARLTQPLSRVEKNENNFESFVIGQISRCDESWKKVFHYAETYRINLSHINSNIEFNKTTNSIFAHSSATVVLTGGVNVQLTSYQLWYESKMWKLRKAIL